MAEVHHDKHGRQIYPGDLLKTYHYTGLRRKRHYLYHVAVKRDGRLWMVPTSELEPTKAGQGGVCLLSVINSRETEIIHGYGPEPYLSFEDRPRIPTPNGGQDE